MNNKADAPNDPAADKGNWLELELEFDTVAYRAMAVADVLGMIEGSAAELREGTLMSIGQAIYDDVVAMKKLYSQLEGLHLNRPKEAEGGTTAKAA